MGAYFVASLRRWSNISWKNLAKIMNMSPYRERISRAVKDAYVAPRIIFALSMMTGPR